MKKPSYPWFEDTEGVPVNLAQAHGFKVQGGKLIAAFGWDDWVLSRRRNDEVARRDLARLKRSIFAYQRAQERVMAAALGGEMPADESEEPE
jgi:hypothetical protein